MTAKKVQTSQPKMQNFYPLVLAITILAFAPTVQTSAQIIHPEKIAEISLATGDGFCADCERVTTLRGDGRATYHGGKNSRLRKGEFSGQISRVTFAFLARTMVDAGFFDLKSRYEGKTSDVATFEITVVYAGGQKTVVNSGRSGEARIKRVERAFNTVAGTVVWVKTKAECRPGIE